MYCENELVLIGSWIGAIMLGGAIMYWYLTWKLDKFGWSWKMITSKISEDEYKKIIQK